MTDANGTPGGVAPGWYADPYGAAPQRWWDGTQWTAHVSQPAAQPYPQAAALQPRTALAPTTPVGTVWIWLIVLLPVLSIALLPLVRFDFAYTFDSAGTSNYSPLNPFSAFSPWYFVLIGLSWLTYAVTVVFSWLDHRELTRRGVVRPFHWAWAFLSSFVYVIGRTVIVRSVAGRRGMAPLWTMIAVTVLSFVVATTWSIMLVTGMVHDISRLSTYGA